MGRVRPRAGGPRLLDALHPGPLRRSTRAGARTDGRRRRNEHLAEKIGWIRDAAGHRFDDIELSLTIFVSMITDDPAGIAAAMGPALGITTEQAVFGIPHVLLARSLDEMVETIQQRREQYGFSYLVFSGGSWRTMAPIVARLAGT